MKSRFILGKGNRDKLWFGGPLVQTLPYLYITCDIVFFGCHFKVDSVLFHYKCFVGWIGCCECDW